jgi:GAF domain-containing protein
MSVHSPQLEEMIVRAIEDVAPQEQEVRDETGRWYSIAVRPYKTGDMRIGGAVVSFVDVTELKKSVDLSRDAAQLSAILAAIGAALSVETDPDRIIAKLVATTAEAMNAPFAMLARERKSAWRIEHVHNLPVQLVGSEIPSGEMRPVVQATRQGRAIVETVGALDSFPALGQAGVSTVLTIPMVIQGDVAVLLLGYENGHRPLTGSTTDFAEKLALALKLALENAELRRAERALADSMREELAPRLEHLGNVDIGYAYTTALEAEHVGGDFLDVVSLDSSTALILIGDVVGVGLRAAQVAAQMRAAVRIMAQDERSPAAILSRLNNVLTGPLRTEQVVTALVAFLDLRTRKLTLSNAGHCEPVLQSNGKALLLQNKHRSPLGAFGDTVYSESEHQMHEGDRLIVYTDGITEARSGSWHYGEDRLLRTLSEHKDAEVQKMADLVMDSALSFAGGKLDDDAVVGVLGLT